MYYLGIDGGGTKTRYVICDKQGNKISSIEGTTTHYFQIGLDGITLELNKRIDELCKTANIDRKQIVSAFVGAPGFGAIEDDKDKIKSAVEKGLGDISFSIGNDGNNALAGALCGEDGINIVAGTGSIGLGYNGETNTTLSCGGWLYALGSDEGSGYWFAQELLHEFTRQADGRDEKTVLYHKLREHLNLVDDGEIITLVVEKWKMDRTKMASLGSLINGLYEDGDPYVIKIVDKASKELADIINTLYIRLGFNKEIKVSYTGGIFKMGDKLLNPLANKLLPGKMKLVSPVLGPEEGSLILALKNGDVAIDDTIINNLKNN